MLFICQESNLLAVFLVIIGIPAGYQGGKVELIKIVFLGTVIQPLSKELLDRIPKSIRDRLIINIRFKVTDFSNNRNANLALLSEGVLNMQIDWNSFKIFNPDAKGLNSKFEDLCRQLFVNEFLAGNKSGAYPHSNPHNPGIEAEPVYDEVNDRRIGFQAKYFEDKVNYNDIKDSAEMTVKHYSGKLDVFYLYCNRSLTSTSESMKRIKAILEAANIDLELITDNAILDLVRKNKNSYLGEYYFGNHTLDMQWFINHSQNMFDGLRSRYNQKVNVDTYISLYLSLFLHDQCAASYYNRKKEELLREINEVRSPFFNSISVFLYELEKAVSKLSDVNVYSLSDVLKWEDTIRIAVQKSLEVLKDERESLNKKLEDIRKQSEEESSNKWSDFRNESYDINHKISEIDSSMNLIYRLHVPDSERELLDGKTLIIHGEAGTGKSHLLAAETEKLLQENRPVLLLTGGQYLTNEPIQKQIMSNLPLDFSFDSLLDILEAIGEKNQQTVPIFIDALNETWEYNLWENGLSSIINKINSKPMLKLVLTYRNGYDKVLLSESIRKKIDSDEVLCLEHFGFEDNSKEAIEKFLKTYNIPFSPSNFLENQMTNPLFLSLYCQTYNGEEVSLEELYERLTDKTNQHLINALHSEISRAYTGSNNLISAFLDTLAVEFIKIGRKTISKEEICKLDFWDDYGLTPMSFITQLKKENMLLDYCSPNDGTNIYFLAFDQMNDYFCAKAIIRRVKKEDIRGYLQKEILGVENGLLSKPGNINLFVWICAGYGKKYHEECINVIDSLKDKEDRKFVFSRYIRSFQWRTTKGFDVARFRYLLNTYPYNSDDLFSMLIGNSLKVSNPLNADFLHSYLFPMDINERDFIWTIYINEAPDEKTQLMSLAEMYSKGEKLQFSDPRQIELLLTLFSWLLTSSNRYLRDITSKAMIEILRENFQYCQVILEKFRDVNDPYVIQRLYGIVFGACCKRVHPEDECFEKLVEYVYETIFNQDKVYPDILLRDYARLIIERFIVENPGYKGCIVINKTRPPYKSEPVPEIEDQGYWDKEYTGGLWRLITSMRPAMLGMYGDFGRYVFESNLHDFDVDVKKIFNYAIYFILNELHYKEETLGVYDCTHSGSLRNITLKTERIGKKYQWIAMYNILARVSDHFKMYDNYRGYREFYTTYEGTWEPFTRDFDPTLNIHFMSCKNAPEFQQLKDFYLKACEDIKKLDISDKSKWKEWLGTSKLFHDTFKDLLYLKGSDGAQWVRLSFHFDVRDRNPETENTSIWSGVYAYFVNSKQKKFLQASLQKHELSISDDIVWPMQTYYVFNREYPWAPSCKMLKKSMRLDTDEYERKDGSLGKILRADLYLLWENEYDASKDKTISWLVPNPALMDALQLNQQEEDGFFYDPDGRLAAYDIGLMDEKRNGLVIRKDLLDRFLSRKRLSLVWFVKGRKEVQPQYPSLNSYSFSEWEGVYFYKKGIVNGDMYQTDIQVND